MARLINGTHVFIHCAKTGGTFFREVINRYGIPNFEIGEKHSPYSEFINTPYKLFGFIRNPIDWYRSRWAYSMITGFSYQLQYNKWAQEHWMAKVWSEDLNVFVENTLRLYPNGVATEYFRKMIDFENGTVEIYRTENIQYSSASLVREFKDIERLNEIVKLPKENVSIYDHNNQTVRNSIGMYKDAKISENLKKEIKTTESTIFKMFYE